MPIFVFVMFYGKKEQYAILSQAAACDRGENCVTCADEGLEAGGSNIIGREWVPATLNTSLKVQDVFDENLKEVSGSVKKNVQGGSDINVGDYEPKKD